MLADLTTAEAQYKAAGAASQRDGHSGESQPVTDDPAVTVGSTLAVGLSNIAFLRREAAKRLHALVCGVVQCGTSAAQDTAAAVRDVDATAPPAYVALVVLAYPVVRLCCPPDAVSSMCTPLVPGLWCACGCSTRVGLLRTAAEHGLLARQPSCFTVKEAHELITAYRVRVGAVVCGRLLL